MRVSMKNIKIRNKKGGKGFNIFISNLVDYKVRNSFPTGFKLGRI